MARREYQRSHALLAPVVANTFEWLDVGCTIWEPGGWRGIHERSSSLDLMRFELEHGVEAERLTYNRRCLAQALRKKTTITAEFAGFTDLFVPICSANRTEGVLVTGPFATARPTSTDIYDRWQKLTGSRGHLSDPEFAHYISTTLSTLVLEGKQAAAFRRRAELCAQLMAGEGSTVVIYREHVALRKELSGARMAERMWDAANGMVDERTSRSWASQNRAWQLRQIGVSGFPEQVVVGLFVSQERSSDPVDELVRRDAFQRACAKRASEVGNVLSGRVGGHGVTLLVAGRGSVARTRRYLLDMTEEVVLLGRRPFGFKVHFGASTRPTPLPEQYRVALAAAEAALSKGVRIVQGGDDIAAAPPLGALRKELARLVEENPAVLPARFDRHLDAIAVRSGYRLDSARAHLEASFELITESFAASGALDQKSLSALLANLDRAVADVGTLSELFAVYRKAVGDIVGATREPRVARRDRSLQRAVAYMQRHQSEVLTLERVARVAGFAPKYFSAAFRKKEGVTFERYLIKLRVELARQLLSRTALDAPLGLDRVAKLSGFSSANYLCRTFKQSMGETPMAYRERVRKGLDVVPREIKRSQTK